jgi:hypothetical protein
MEEATAVRFADPEKPPDPLDPPARRALALLDAFLADGEFQVR